MNKGFEILFITLCYGCLLYTPALILLITGIDVFIGTTIWENIWDFLFMNKGPLGRLLSALFAATLVGFFGCLLFPKLGSPFVDKEN